jgi:hypothetical protein
VFKATLSDLFRYFVYFLPILVDFLYLIRGFSKGKG